MERAEMPMARGRALGGAKWRSCLRLAALMAVAINSSKSSVNPFYDLLARGQAEVFLK